MPPQVPQMNPALAQLSQQLTRMQAQIARLERNQRASQMGNTSIDGGALVVNDGNGNQALTVGLQPDGTYTTVNVTSQAPPVAPDQPLCGPGVLGVWVYWDGVFADGSAPLADFAGIQVHCSAISGFTPDTTTLQGAMPGMGLFGVGNLTAGTTYYIVFIAVNEAGNTSPPSVQAQCEAGSVPANIPAGSISGLQIQTGTLTAAQLAAEAGILGSQIAANTITDNNIVAGTITADSIASNVLTAQQIVAGTITAGLLAAGIVVAGIVDGTTITGATLVADGASGQVLVYPGTPASGNLVASVSGIAGTDSVGNPYLAGFVNYFGTVAVQVADGTINFATFAVGVWTVVNQFALNAGTVDGVANALSTSGPVEIPALYAGQVVVGPGVISANNPADPQWTAETWHTITLDTGWTAGSPAPQYRLLADGNVQLAGKATHAAITTETAVNSTHALGTAYRPASDKKIYQGNRAGGLTGAALDTTGIVYAEPNGTSATTVDLTGITDLL